VTAEATCTPKLIYFAERPPGYDLDAFRVRWRRHAELGMAQPRWRNIARYVHCDGVATSGSRLPIDWCDGIAMVWYRSEEYRLRHVSDRSSGPIMKQDEKATFARPVSEVAALTEEHIHRPCQPSRYKLFLRISIGQEASRAAFQSQWSRQQSALMLRALDAQGGCRGYVQNFSRPVNTAVNVPPPICDCIDEFATNDIHATERAVHEVLEALGDQTLHVVATWTAETLLYGQ
jgi:hypothetical protein